MVARRGVTLMELIMVMSIVTVLFAVSAPLLLQANRQFIMTNTRLQLQQEARGVMYIITRNLREAKSSTVTINRANSGQPFYSQITFTKEQGNVMEFRQVGTTLYQVIGGSQRVLSSNLSYLAFTFPRSDDMGIISVSLTLRKNIYEGRTKALHMASEKVRIMD
jgi:prepilin-type N-terminal cleavage/methylation domain-containing protein